MLTTKEELLAAIRESFENYEIKDDDGGFEIDFPIEQLTPNLRKFFEYKGEPMRIRIFFKNGYGASIVRNGGSYGSKDGLFELAVLTGEEKDWEITYDTPVTDDVLGSLDLDELIVVLKEIRGL